MSESKQRGYGRGGLTDAAIKAWVGKAQGDGSLHDGGGLYLRKRGVGAFWALRQVNPESGKRPWAGLFPGVPYPNATLAEARRKAIEAKLRAADAPTDIVRERQAARAAAVSRAQAAALQAQSEITVRALFAKWQATDLPPRRGADGRRHGRKDGGEYVQAQFERRVFPTLGDTAIGEVKRADLMAVLDAIKAEGKLTTANRVFADLNQMLRFALKRDIIERNPLDTIARKDVGGAEAARQRVLAADEIKRLSDVLPEARMSARSSVAIWLILSTGCRVSEAMMARWEHVNLEARTWHLPETKNERNHTIHLSAFAVRQFRILAATRATDLLESREKHAAARPSDWVFPSADGKSSVCAKSFGKQLSDRQRPAQRKMKNRSTRTESLVLTGGRWTAHDLRRTAATMMAKLGISGDVIDECLNHMIESRVRRTYVIDRREADQVKAFDALGEFLTTLVRGER